MTTTLDWYGCATFRLRTGGLTIFLDAYIDRAANAAGPQPRQRADDIDECDWIVIGHSHFDHLYGAERIMANTSATLIGSYESVRVMAEAGVPEERMVCVAGGETVELGNDVTVSVYPSQHSCVWSHTKMHAADEVCVGDLGVTWHEQQRRMARADAVRHDVAGAAGDRARHRVTGRSQPAWRRRRARLRLRHAGRPAAVPGHVGPLERRPPRPPTRRGDPRRGRPGQHRRRADPGFARRVRRPPGRDAAAAFGRAQPPRRLAPGLLHRHRRHPDPRRDRDASPPRLDCSSSTTSTPPRSSPDVRSQVAGQGGAVVAKAPHIPARLT